GRIRQILTNLIGNAIKFTERGHVLLHVAVEQETTVPRAAIGASDWPADVTDGQDGPPAITQVTFSVQDTGIGIAPEARSRLFQAFSQADGSTTRRYGGTGLGLTISRQLVDLMGGHISLDSMPGR